MTKTDVPTPVPPTNGRPWSAAPSYKHRSVRKRDEVEIHRLTEQPVEQTDQMDTSGFPHSFNRKQMNTSCFPLEDVRRLLQGLSADEFLNLVLESRACFVKYDILCQHLYSRFDSSQTPAPAPPATASKSNIENEDQDKLHTVVNCSKATDQFPADQQNDKEVSLPLEKKMSEALKTILKKNGLGEHEIRMISEKKPNLIYEADLAFGCRSDSEAAEWAAECGLKGSQKDKFVASWRCVKDLFWATKTTTGSDEPKQWKHHSNTEHQRLFALHELGGEAAVREQRRISVLISEEARKNLRIGQVPWEQDQIYQGLDCSFLLRDSEKALHTLRQSCKEMGDIIESEGLEVSIIEGPLKGIMRSKTKVSVKYGGDVRQLMDVARFTLQIKGRGRDTIKKTYKALEKLIAGSVSENGKATSKVRVATGTNREWKILYFHDRYRKPATQEYRDFLMIVQVCGVLCEVQINFDMMLHIKEGVGHDDYVVERLNQDLMLEAARQNDASAVSQHLGKTASQVDYKTANGYSALSFAALHGNHQMAAKLLELKADPFILDGEGNIPIIRAIERNYALAAMKILKAMAIKGEDYSQPLVLSAGACLGVLRSWTELKTKNVSSSLFCDERKSAHEMKSEFLDKFQPVFDRVSGGVDAALSLAAKNGDSQVCACLLDANANPDIQFPFLEKWKLVLDDAVHSGSVATVRTLLDYRAHLGIYARIDRSDENNPVPMGAGAPLRVLAWHGREYETLYKKILHSDHDTWRCLDAVLEATENQWCNMEEMLAKAAKSLALQAAQVLLHRGATAMKVAVEDLDPLVRFAAEQQDEVMLEQLQAYPQPSIVEKKIFHQAARTGQRAILALLVEKKCKLGEMDINGTVSAVHLAAAEGHTSIIRYLAQQKCDVKKSYNTGGRTAACEAARYGHVQTLLDLSRDGLWDLNASAFLKGYNAGHGLAAAAAYSSRSATLYALVLAGVDVNRKSEKGDTPAHLAAYVGAVNCLKVIAKVGGDLWRLNHEEEYPQDLAGIYKHAVLPVLQESCRENTLGDEDASRNEREARYRSKLAAKHQLNDDDSLSERVKKKEWYKSIAFKGKDPTSEIAILLAGGPGSGKSYVVENVLNEFEGLKNKTASSPGSGEPGKPGKEKAAPIDNVVILNRDQVLEDLYENDMKYWRDAGTIFKDIRSRAIEQGYNLILDGTGRYVPHWLEMADQIKKPNENHPSPRKVVLVIVLCSVGKALERCKKRYEETGRKITDAYAVETYSAMDEVIATYIGPEAHHFDEIRIYDNASEGHEPDLVYKRNAQGTSTIFDSEDPDQDNTAAQGTTAKDTTKENNRQKPWWVDCMPKTAIELQSHKEHSQYLKEMFPHKDHTDAENGFALFAFGGPGSQTSKAVQKEKEKNGWGENHQHVVEVNKNQVLRKMFQNNDSFKDRRDLICDGMLARAISEEYSFIQDGSGQDISKCLETVSQIRKGVIEKGHRKRTIVLLITICSRAKGLQRQREKLATNGITFEEDRALAVYQNLDNMTATYLCTESRHFDKILIYDSNDSDDPRLIYERNPHGQIHILGKPLKEEVSWKEVWPEVRWWHQTLPHTKQAMVQSWVVEKFKKEILRAEAAPHFAIFTVGHMMCENRSSKKNLVDKFLKQQREVRRELFRENSNEKADQELRIDNYVYLNEQQLKKSCQERLIHTQGGSNEGSHEGLPSLYTTDSFMHCLACKHASDVYKDLCEKAITKGYNLVVDGVGFEQKKWTSLMADLHWVQRSRPVILLVVISKEQLEENCPKAEEARDASSSSNEAFDRMISSYVKKRFHYDHLFVYDGDNERALYPAEDSTSMPRLLQVPHETSWVKKYMPETYKLLERLAESNSQPTLRGSVSTPGIDSEEASPSTRQPFEKRRSLSRSQSSLQLDSLATGSG